MPALRWAALQWQTFNKAIEEWSLFFFSPRPLTLLHFFRAVGTVPPPNMVTYYAQRASEGGLLLSKATCIGPRAHGRVKSLAWL